MEMIVRSFPMTVKELRQKIQLGEFKDTIQHLVIKG